MIDEHLDVAVVGAGLVGLAAALQLQRREPALDVAVVEAEDRVAAHQSGHNSGVVHAGVYYQPGSLKARLCREGRAELLDFARAHDIPHRVDGKLIVAVDPTEYDRLDALHDRATANGLRGVRLLYDDALREVEPNVAGRRALLVPETGVIDFSAVADAYRDEVVSHGGTVHLKWPVQHAERDGDGWRLRSRAQTIRARCLLCCAGLFTDPLLDIVGLAAHRRTHRIVPFRGNYLSLGPAAAPLVRSLIYPVPDPELPFLGVHLTRGIDDHVHAGPNAVPSLGRADNGFRHLATPELLRTLSFPGAQRLARRYMRVGAGELWRNAVRSAAVRRLRRYLPELTTADVQATGGGVRAQCVARDGSLVDDFLIAVGDKVVAMINAPSPAATASMAIGQLLADRTLASLRTPNG